MGDEDVAAASEDLIVFIDFDDEDNQGEMESVPVVPFYEQVDAVVVTFPKASNGQTDKVPSLRGALV